MSSSSTYKENEETQWYCIYYRLVNEIGQHALATSTQKGKQIKKQNKRDAQHIYICII